MNIKRRFDRLVVAVRKIFLLIVIIVGMYTLGNIAVQTYNETNVPPVQCGLLAICG